MTLVLRMDCDIALMPQNSQAGKLVLSGHTACTAVTYSLYLVQILGCSDASALGTAYRDRQLHVTDAGYFVLVMLAC